MRYEESHVHFRKGGMQTGIGSSKATEISTREEEET